MNTDAEIIIHPYSLQRDNSLLHLLVREFSSGAWEEFRGAIHFIKQSGNYQELFDAMKGFLEGGGRIQLTFGADVFGSRNPASEYDAVRELLHAFENYHQFSVYLYHEKGRTFHPKIYLFSAERAGRALLVVGSSNWSEGGFGKNVEVNIKVALDLRRPDHRASYGELLECFAAYWTEEQ